MASVQCPAVAVSGGRAAAALPTPHRSARGACRLTAVWAELTADAAAIVLAGRQRPVRSVLPCRRPIALPADLNMPLAAPICRQP